jgi:hypothetical protein
MTRALVIAALVCAAGCSDDAGTPPIGKVPGKLGKLAVGTSSLFAIDTTDSSLVEIGLDGALIGKLPTVGPVSEVSASGDLVAWVEAEGSNGKIKRRKAGMVETLATLTFKPHVIATDEGVAYSDTGIIGLWAGATPDRIATPTGAVTIIGIDSSYAYALDANNAVQRYDRRMDMAEMVVAGAMGATVKAGMLAYRTADGVRIHDLFTKFDAVFGMPPSGYACELLLAGRAVMCGKYRCLEAVTEELLDDPVAGYAANGRDLYWTRTSGSNTELYQIDSEIKLDQ